MKTASRKYRLLACFILALGGIFYCISIKHHHAQQPVAINATTPKAIKILPADTMQKHTADSATIAAQKQQWLQSLQQTVKRGCIDYTDEHHHEKQQLQYISACNQLGDYYLAQYYAGDAGAIGIAMRYYTPVTFFTDETDSKLGANERAIRARNRMCKKVAVLYNKGLWPIDSMKSIFTGRYINAATVNLHNALGADWADSGMAHIRFVYGNSRLTKDAQRTLRQLLYRLPGAPEKKIFVSGNNGNTSKTQEVSWEQTNAVIEFMIAHSAIKKERFIFHYDGEGNESSVLVRFAKDGEDGPYTVPPPHPDLNDLP